MEAHGQSADARGTGNLQGCQLLGNACLCPQQHALDACQPAVQGIESTVHLDSHFSNLGRDAEDQGMYLVQEVGLGRGLFVSQHAVAKHRAAHHLDKGLRSKGG
jgi:hypothetical protein